MFRSHRLPVVAALAALASLSAVACSSATGSDPGAGSEGSTGAPGSSSSATDDGGSTSTSSSPGSSGDDAGVTAPISSDGGKSSPGTGTGADGGKSPHDGGTTPSGDSGTPPTSTSTTEYAPYFPTWIWGGSGYAVTGLADLHAKSGMNEVTIAFVLSNGGCNTTQDIEQNLTDVKAFIAAGGHVKASFGGADGAYVESKCTTAATFAGAIEDFVDATGITDLDFDIEQDAVLTDAVNEMRGQALKMAQDAKGIQVAFTLAANPSPGGGMTSQGLSVVSHAFAAGVKVSHVNMMTMDYGDSFAGKALAPVAIGSITDAMAQLMTLDTTLTKAQAWAMTGVIPMIGKNDDSEVFSLDDAKTLAAFATTNGVGLVSFWSVDRDQVCPSGADFNSCSTVDTANFAFNALLKTVAE